ncbi:hypothetical protein BDY24DRAFT_388053 [Mrakia frigida]|uniref:sumo domain-containing protein n=1 Tax=Mrakia frigida TaxID=29902 RepID=UPI003FCC12C5
MASSTCCVYTFVDSDLIPERVIGVVYETRAQAISFLKSEEGLAGVADLDDSSFLFTIDSARIADIPVVWSNAMSFYSARVGSLPLQIEVGIRGGENDRPTKRKREFDSTAEEESGRQLGRNASASGCSSSSRMPQSRPSAKAEEQAPEIPPAPPSQPSVSPPPPQEAPVSPPSQPSAPLVPASPEGGPSSSVSRDATPRRRKFNIGIKRPEDEEPTFFSVKLKTPMSKVFQAYADKVEAEVDTLSFEFENEEEERWEVSEMETVESVGMKDGSVLEVTHKG